MQISHRAQERLPTVVGNRLSVALWKYTSVVEIDIKFGLVRGDGSHQMLIRGVSLLRPTQPTRTRCCLPVNYPYDDSAKIDSIVRVVTFVSCVFVNRVNSVACSQRNVTVCQFEALVALVRP